MRVIFNHTMNRQVRMLDGQWQGVRLASDGRVYFFGGSHSAGVSAPFFRFDPTRGVVELLALDMSRICSEDPSRTPTQGKVHSDILEHKGWLYFGTHLSDYTPEGSRAYTGGHLVGYEMATGRFRDFGVIHPNYTNYSAIGLDALRERVYFYATPFGEGDGPHLHRIGLDSGENRDLGLVAPWTGRDQKGRGHGQPCQHLFVDGRGDVWFALRGEHALFVAREGSGRIERHDGVLPGNANQWFCVRPIDEDRCLAVLPDGFYIFDSRRAGAGDSRQISGAFSLLCKVETPGFTWAYVAMDHERIWWNSRSQRTLADNRHEVRIHSLSRADPSKIVDHGPVNDGQGRAPWFLGDLVSDGCGRLYSCGRWYIRPEEEEEIGVDRNGLMVAVFFTALEV